MIDNIDKVKDLTREIEELAIPEIADAFVSMAVFDKVHEIYNQLEIITHELMNG